MVITRTTWSQQGQHSHNTDNIVITQTTWSQQHSYNCRDKCKFCELVENKWRPVLNATQKIFLLMRTTLKYSCCKIKRSSSSHPGYMCILSHVSHSGRDLDYKPYSKQTTTRLLRFNRAFIFSPGDAVREQDDTCTRVAPARGEYRRERSHVRKLISIF